jgi:hypothetical protein
MMPPRPPPPEKFRDEIPAEFYNQLDCRRVPREHGFAWSLWHLLTWAAEQSPFRESNLGCGWVSPTEFWLDKQRFSQVVKLPLNTLNFKLRQGKFEVQPQRKGSISHWTHPKFTQRSTEADLEAIDRIRTTDDTYQAFMLKALYIPCLDEVRLFVPPSPHDVSRFKSESVHSWVDLVGVKSIWAVSFRDFVSRAAIRFCRLLEQQQGPSEFVSFIKEHALNMVETAQTMISYVMTHRVPHIVEIVDFHKFMARFGPDGCVLEKIHQLLCHSQAYGRWFQPDVQKFDASKPVTGSYSNTFANCFVIRRSPGGGTYHVYNLVNAGTQGPFLVDESGKKFLSWQAVLDAFTPAPQAPFTYGFSYADDFA